jgi:hypothetical protein
MMHIGVIPLFRRGLVCDPDWVAELVTMLDEEEVESLWGVEHVLVAENYKPNYPYSPDGRMPTDRLTSMPDPLAWLTFAVAHSRRLKIATGVLILPQYSPVQLAKRLATLDQLTRGRVMLGAGLGWQEEEYAALNIPFAERGIGGCEPGGRWACVCIAYHEGRWHRKPHRQQARQATRLAPGNGAMSILDTQDFGYREHRRRACFSGVHIRGARSRLAVLPIP